MEFTARGAAAGPANPAASDTGPAVTSTTGRRDAPRRPHHRTGPPTGIAHRRFSDELVAEQLEAFGELADTEWLDSPGPDLDIEHALVGTDENAANDTSAFGATASQSTKFADQGGHGLSINLLTQAKRPPDWHLFTRFFEFLFESETPDEIVHRAAAGLGLLPQIAWTDVDGGPSDEPGHASVFFEASNSSTEDRWLAVKLDDPRDDEAGMMVRGILSLVDRLYRRECRALELIDQAHTDPLTGLWNRRGFTPLLDQALGRVVRHGEQITLLLCDLDHFKQINDIFGHAAGDDALTCVASSILRVLRPSDLAVRLGGDEIAILLSGSDAEGAIQVTHRLRDSIADANPLAPHPLQLSIGVADSGSIGVFDDPARARRALMDAADQALYAAKAAGRNCARCYEG